MDTRKVVLYVPDNISQPIKTILKQNNCNILRDLPFCSQESLEDIIANQPDVVIISEYIQWDKVDLLKAIRFIRANSANATQIIAHVRERQRGDMFLKDLVGLAIYDILLKSHFNVLDIWKMIEHPSSYGDVIQYHYPDETTIDTQLPRLEDEVHRNILSRWEEDIDETQTLENYETKNTNIIPVKINQIIKRLGKDIKHLFINELKSEKSENQNRNTPVNDRLIKQPLMNTTPNSSKPVAKIAKKTGQEKPAEVEKHQIIKSNKLILVIGTDRYVGTTTVTVNLARKGQIIYYPHDYHPEGEWPEGYEVRKINLKEYGKWLSGNNHNEMLIDCGHYTKVLDPWIAKADVVFLVAENRSKCLESASKIKMTARTRLIINKATLEGIKPIILSRALNVPYSALIPYDTEFSNNFGLSLTRAPWKTLRNLIDRQIS